MVYRLALSLNIPSVFGSLPGQRCQCWDKSGTRGPQGSSTKTFPFPRIQKEAPLWLDLHKVSSFGGHRLVTIQHRFPNHVLEYPLSHTFYCFPLTHLLQLRKGCLLAGLLRVGKTLKCAGQWLFQDQGWECVLYRGRHSFPVVIWTKSLMWY